MPLKNLSLLFHTIKFLKPKQLYFFAYYRLCGFNAVYFNGFSEPHKIRFSIASSFLSHYIIDPFDHTLTFLNQTHSFDLDNFDWAPKSQKRLWQYNLHYFDYLHQDELDSHIKDRLVDDWIANNPQGKEPAWEPYTVSLRIVNWAIYFSKKDQLAQPWVDSLYLQTLWLRNNLEFHILANHYFENLRALFIASVFFKDAPGKEGKTARSWFEYSCKNLFIELNVQFFEDGGHYERSPQYHSILINACLDIYSCAIANEVRLNSALDKKLTSVIIKGLELLDDICRPDGLIPLFRDSAFDTTPKLENLNHRAETLGLKLEHRNKRAANALKPIARKEFGVYGLTAKSDWFVMNCGQIGPNYQPGHTHCDLLSYEIVLDGQPLIVDSGVFEYQPGKKRRQYRSTEMHNTLSIVGHEQSEIWGEFRVARRAKIERVIQENELPNSLRINATCAAYPSLGKIKHIRKALVELNDNGIEEISFEDEIHDLPNNLTSAQNNIHFHPDIIPTQIDQTTISLSTQKCGFIATLSLDNVSDLLITDSYYSPEFGLEQNNKKIVFTLIQGKSTYRIIKRSPSCDQ